MFHANGGDFIFLETFKNPDVVDREFQRKTKSQKQEFIYGLLGEMFSFPEVDVECATQRK